MTPIETNKPLFFNLDGEPLNGTIYIGQPDTDPRTNPKTVTFRDSGGSEFTASQPLTTINGRISYNGKPIVALVDGEYSLLSFDKFGAQVDYDESIVPAGGTTGGIADFSEVTRVGLTLDEVKGFDVSVGDVVQNVGESLATDGNGFKWLVISPTGSPGDDIELIDFDNGLQGSIIKNQPFYDPVTVEIGGDFSPGISLTFQRLGNFVMVSSAGVILTTSSPESFARSPVGFIPSQFRPSAPIEIPGVSAASPPSSYAWHSYGFLPDGEFNATTLTGNDVTTNVDSSNTSFGRISGIYSI